MYCGGKPLRGSQIAYPRHISFHLWCECSYSYGSLCKEHGSWPVFILPWNLFCTETWASLAFKDTRDAHSGIATRWMMANAIESAFVGAYLSTFLYGMLLYPHPGVSRWTSSPGAYIVIAYYCSLVMYHRYKTKQLHMYLLGTHIALFLLINLVCSSLIGLCQRLTGDVSALHDNYHPHSVWCNAPKAGWYNQLHPLWSSWSLIENSAWVLTILVADAFLVRSNIFWGGWYSWR